MAVAPEVIEAAGDAASETGAAGEGTPWRAISQASGSARRAPAAAGRVVKAVSSPSAASATVTKLLWAVAVGLIVLEIAAEATGQRWSFALPSVGRGPAPKQPYAPLYSGQPTLASALPGVLGAAGTPGLKPNPGTGGI